MNKLEQLKKVTTVVADTGDIAAIRQYAPVDATTNPSLLLKVATDPSCAPLIDEALRWADSRAASAEDLSDVIDRLAVIVGREIIGVIPGRVSTEVSASLSFNTEATLARARKIVALYSELGIPTDRVLIKIASTWEGIRAAEILEKEGIQCNLTLLFGFGQAVACADAGVFLISPFVGRIYDWYKASTGREYSGADDPGVQSVRRIFNYYKAYDYPTVVMGASFRNTGQIEALAGCDRLTISPQLLDELSSSHGELTAALNPAVLRCDDRKMTRSEQMFRWELNQDAMATEKLAEGIRKFHEDEVRLQAILKSLIASKSVD
ncbi:MAG: transaldolase [Gammaproteobacteria bacterium BRH_c0]|nr:MAG: transaldolase [Gammaproteobacteria bacterium BRH_c0]